MYYLKKKIIISAAHKLDLSYKSKCSNLHGHNWHVTVYCKSTQLDHNGMIIDFAEIKGLISNLDHCDLNEVLDFNPTAENLSRYICESIPLCYRVDVEESPNNIVSYERS